MSGWIRWAACGAATAGVVVGCGITAPDIDTTGTVRFVDVEGGCWGLRTSEGSLHPINLTQEFKVDGLAVRFEADYRKDLVGFCPGDMVELKRIERM